MMLRVDDPTFGRRRGLRIALLGCVAVVAFAIPATAAQATTFTAVADSYVDASNPTANFGNSTTLRVDGSPRLTTYLKFDVSGLPSPSSAALRVFVTSDNTDAFAVYEVANTSWSESTINASNAPAVGDIVASSGPVTAEQLVHARRLLSGDQRWTGEPRAEDGQLEVDIAAQS